MQLNKLSQDKDLVKTIENMLANVKPTFLGMQNPMLVLDAIEILQVIEWYIFTKKKE